MNLQEELKALNFPERNELKSTLAESAIPLEAIEAFQNENSIQLATLKPAMPLLDLLGVSRYTFHQQVVDVLKERLIARIHRLAESGSMENLRILGELLKKCFPAILVERMVPVILELMKSLPRVDEVYLRYLMNNVDLYQQSPVEVKRHIWLINQDFFEHEITPLLNSFASRMEEHMESLESNHFEVSSKVRRQDPNIVKLMQLIGDSNFLYQHSVKYLLALYVNTKNPFYASARFCLLMAYHDSDKNGNSEIIRSDPVHKFAWILDACIRKRFIDSSRLKELDSIFTSHSGYLEDVKMNLILFILCDPFVLFTLVRTIIAFLMTIVEKEGVLPRSNTDLFTVTKLLNASVCGWSILSENETPSFDPPSYIMLDVYPAFLTILTDMKMTEFVEGFRSPSPCLSDQLIELIEKEHICTIVWQQVILESLEQKDISIFLKLLSPTKDGSFDTTLLQDKLWLHQFSHYIIRNRDHFSSAQFCKAIFNDFFCVDSENECFLNFAHKIFISVYPRIPISQINSIVLLLKPKAELSSPLWSSYNRIKMKADTFIREQEMLLPHTVSFDMLSSNDV